jgi:N-acetylmuramic acid 6-phosphate etherase
MVDVRVDNLKLRARAVRMISAIGRCPEAEALSLLEKAGGSVKSAVLLAAGAATLDGALELLDGAGQNLRSALSKLEGSRNHRQEGT